MRKYRGGLFTILFLCLGITGAYSQSCASSNNNTAINFSCGVNCGAINLQLPDIKTTSDYTVTTIPYAPYAYTTATGIEDQNIYNDDKYSFLTPIGFPFCFYDSVFTQVVVGSNGLISFDYDFGTCPSTMVAAWNISNSIPYNSNLTTCNSGTSNYPRASVMGVFMDLDPRPGPASAVNSSPRDRKIEWRVEGTAPCRRFIASYYHIGVFQATTCGVNTPATFQIVLYESTGIIDVYIENKICPATSTNGINAITGIMDWSRRRAQAVPGKNGTSWTAQNEAYRFTPSGGTSRFLSSQLFTLNGTLVGPATVTNTTPGLIDLSFPDVCPAGNSQQFIVRTSFSSCSDPLESLIYDDTITINKISSLGATAAVTNLNCATGSTGSITLNVPPNSGVPPYQYSINGGPLQSNNTFSGLSVGNYVVYATDVNGCNSSLNVTVSRSGSLGVGFSVTNSSCPGINNGAINILPPSVYTPIQYSINSGPPQVSNIFTGLAAGSYTINVTDAIGCKGATTITVLQGAGVTATFATTSTACSGANNGTITVTPGGGNLPYQYSLDGGPYQNSNIFTGLAAGSYTVNVRDVNGCNSNFAVTINPGAPLNATIAKTNVACNSGSNGTIIVNISNGAAPYQYSLDNVTWQTSNSFSGLAAGTYTVYYKDNNACFNSQTITITQPAILNATLATQAVRCFGSGDGVITVTASGGTSPYQYSLDGVTYQNGNTFNVSAGSFTVYIKDVNGCTKTQTITVTQPLALTATANTINATCNGGADGQITVSANGGTAPYGFTISVPPLQSSNVFNVTPGTYNVTVVDANSCLTLIPNVIVGLNNNLSITPAPDITICEGKSTQLNVTTNANQFLWTPAASLSNSTIQNPVASPVVTTSYIVTAMYGQCSGKDTIVVNVNAAPIPDAGPDGDICYGQDYRLNGSGGVQFAWSPSTSLSSISVFNPLSNPQQTTTYSLSVVDALGCASLTDDKVVVKVTPPIIVKTFPADTVVFGGDKFQLFATSAATDYTWTPPTGLSDPFIANPVLTVTTDVTFNVIATTSAGCRGDGTVTIKVFKGPEIYMPTGFTPNGDGRNDKFKPFTVGITGLNYFKVYNRWGQLIFSTNKLNDGWDGKLGGADQPSGTFVWMVQGTTVDGRLITKKGTVTLIR